jgi:hypothetical protein
MEENMKLQPIFTVRGNDLPRREIYKRLKNLWLKENNSTNRQLALLLGVTPQVASTYGTGTDGRTPPWSTILTLCHQLGYQIVLRPNEIKIEKSLVEIL